MLTDASSVTNSDDVKIKDLPETESLLGARFRYPGDGQPYYWSSQWEKGVWAKKDMGSGELFPLFVEDLKEALEWEIVPEDES